MRTELHVAFLWHMHQPSYRDPETGEIAMPWVRLHASRDYTDMATVMAHTPEARATVNWVPGLLDQCAALAEADYPERDRFWRLSTTPPERLTDADRLFIQTHFFSLPHATMLEPFPRYRELRDRLKRHGRLHPTELGDLQAWFNLAWCGHTLHARPDLRAILAQGAGFSAEQRQIILEAQREAALSLQARWSDLARQGQVELALSPYYHPIVPLLIDTDAARDADPRSPLPSRPFRHPEDARAHVRRALTGDARHFGDAPPIRGMWPSEGSVSEGALQLFAEAGLDWIATDEAILQKSLARAGQPDPLAHFSPWRRQGLTLFFRDHGLSDRIGFVYSRWAREDAWRDFVSHLQKIRAGLAARGQARGVVVIALDGENCWEHYPGGITAFLPGLYRHIAASDGLTLSTLGEARAALADAHRDLPTLAPGSWIDGTFRTWLGDPVKNLAWDHLAAARQACGASLPALQEADPTLADLIMRAEASDWWWWFGEGHSSTFDDHFDTLFRAHLRAIWRHLGRPCPEGLDRPLHSALNQTDADAPSSTAEADSPPSSLLSITADGDDSWYYKWHGAGRIAPRFGAIHRAEALLRGLLYGNDASHLHLCLDIGSRDALAQRGLQDARLCLFLETSAAPLCLPLTPEAGAPDPGILSAHDHTFEASIPASCLAPHIRDGKLRGWIELQQPAGTAAFAPIERFPAEGAFTLTILTPRQAALGRLT